VKQTYRNPFGQLEPTRAVFELGDDPSPYRGCKHKDPGHNWTKARVQRDLGFLASGTGNDSFATSYYMAENIPVRAHIARRFTVMDHHHASLLGPTWPNRQYLYSAQSEG
jgi:phospholipase C